MSLCPRAEATPGQRSVRAVVGRFSLATRRLPAMNAHSNSPGKRRPRWLRFHLRSLVLLVTFAAILLGLHQAYIRPYHQQRQAADALKAKGVSLTWEPAEPAWLANILKWIVSADKLQDCVVVDAEHAGLEDADMVHVGQLPRLKRLYLARNPVTDAGLAQLRGLEHLERLSLWGTRITNDGLRHVGKLRSLKVLDIHHVLAEGFPPYGFGSTPTPRGSTGIRYPRTYPGPLSGECFEHLREAHQLRALHFSFALDDEDLAQLAKLPNVRIRTLVLRNVTAEGLAQLSDRRDLETLVIQQASLGERGLRDLAGLPRLKWLKLRGVRAAGQGWETLEQLRRLEELSLDLCPLDDRAVRAVGRLHRLKQLSLQVTGLDDRQVSALSNLTNLESLDLRNTLVTADCLEHLPGLARLTRLGLQAPLDDHAVKCLAQLPNLETIVSGKDGYQMELYLSDAGMAELARLRGLGRIKIQDAIAGAELDGIDVAKGAGTISDEGVARLLDGSGARMLYVIGQDLTAGSLRWSPQLTDWGHIRIRSAKPLHEMITGPLGIGAGGATFSYRTLNLTSPDGIGPRGVGFSFGDGPLQLEILRYLPDIRQLKLGTYNHRESSECDWDHLRFVPKLEDFEMDGYASSPWRIDAPGVKRLGQMRDLRRLVAHLAHDLSADAFAPLGNLNKLEEAKLYFDGLKEAHVNVLGNCRRLKSLEIFGNPSPRNSSSDDRLPLGTHHLQQLGELETLRIYGVAKEDLAPLVKLRKLKRLHIEDTDIDGNALAPLKNLPHLDFLAVDMKEATPQRQQQIKQLLPSTRVRIY